MERTSVAFQSRFRFNDSREISYRLNLMMRFLIRAWVLIVLELAPPRQARKCNCAAQASGNSGKSSGAGSLDVFFKTDPLIKAPAATVGMGRFESSCLHTEPAVGNVGPTQNRIIGAEGIAGDR